MRRRVLAAVAASCLVLGGCHYQQPAAPTPAPAAESQLPAASAAEKPFALPVDPAGGWDPYVGSKSSNMALLGLVCEGLYALDNTFTPRPVLAKEARVSDDGLVWTVTLREGITFSNGEALDAKAAADALTAAAGAKSLYAARLAGVKKISAEGESALTFQLAAPNAGFLALLDVPVALVTKDGVFGTGPYVVAEGALAARDDWWQGLELPLASIPLVEAGEADGLIGAFNAGDVALVAVDPTGPDTPGWSGSFQDWEYPTSTMLYLGFRCSAGPCKSAALRRAISRAVDRDTIAGRVLQGHAVAATLPAPAGAPRYDKALAATLSYDVLAAAELLDEAGYKLGEDGLRYSGKRALALSLLVNSDNPYKESLARAAADSLEGLGVQVTVKALGWEEYKKALERGDFDLYVGEARLTGDLDPGCFLTAGSGLYFGGFQSAALSAALAEARAGGKWDDFYGQWAEEVPLAVLCFKNASVLTQWGRVSGVEPTQGNLFSGFEKWKLS